ncbi:peptidase U32 family protein [Ferribacterium limneticum]|uniref:peptidase U32 family protein n=1 Tax=Ferribacterium limneticum TaxID=76259 RepID=UPI001CFB5E78|nr:U32 family peptidase [Ferribacterium limneticum]UCV26918.1 U32 family peptidase [Ferribacterium limneticum]UCV30835.1 U32 family peptidase [Ferribacterium limneticum]
MTRIQHPLELLAPAKNADFGIEAIKHGADAVYIGGPTFGARYGAGNSVAEIRRLCDFAHRYRAKVFVALNTILHDDELEGARLLAWELYEAGTDALIIQDMGLLELDLPPIQLHASTQTDNRNPAKVKFLEKAGFSQVVLAREMSIQEVQAVADETTLALEYFVHGALCVAFSGQCYISQAHTGRSANRGECSQACRLPYTLVDDKGKTITENQHLLSMKDNNQTDNMLELARAGISSFKIEGRLKDLSYVKNITAHYRTLLDEIIANNPEFTRASSGRSTYTFTPQPDKTFNRGYTDYFANDRQDDIGAFDSPAFVGELIGDVAEIGDGWFMVNTDQDFHNGDGVCFYDAHGDLLGMRINRAEGKKLFPAEMPEALTEGATLFRNRDQEFERALEKDSADRCISVKPLFSETADGFRLTLTDEDGVTAAVDLPRSDKIGNEIAQNADQALAKLKENLSKFGNTMFIAEPVELQLSQPWFLPVSAINALRREATEKLEAARIASHPRPLRATPAANPVPYPQEELTYLGNVFNAKARQFYEKHGVKLIEEAYEAGNEKGMVSLMITRHCLRYSFNLCPKEVKHLKPDPMTLINGNEKLILKFDCKACEMHVIGKMKKGVKLNLGTIRPA